MAAPYGGPRFLAAGTGLARREGRQVSLPLRGPGGPHPFLRTGPRKAAVGQLRMVISTLGGELSGWVGDLVHNNHRGLCVQQMWASDGLATMYCVTSAEDHGSSHLLWEQWGRLLLYGMVSKTEGVTLGAQWMTGTYEASHHLAMPLPANSSP